MYITKYNSAYPTFANLVNSFFEDENHSNRTVSFQPKVDIAETEKYFEIQASLPGLEKENFTIEINENILTIKGERKFINEENGKTFKSVETKYGSFSRSFTLPDNTDKENIEAEYVNGILKILIPKTEIQVHKKQVVIK